MGRLRLEGEITGLDFNEYLRGDILVVKSIKADRAEVAAINRPGAYPRWYQPTLYRFWRFLGHRFLDIRGLPEYYRRHIVKEGETEDVTRVAQAFHE
jgi:hypothetical protein